MNNLKNEKLLACPFCGGKAVYINESDTMVTCPNEDCLDYQNCFVYKLWNTRRSPTRTEQSIVFKKNKAYLYDGSNFIETDIPGFIPSTEHPDPLLEAPDLIELTRNEIHKIVDVVRLAWSFNDRQEPTHSWHCKNDCIRDLEILLRQYGKYPIAAPSIGKIARLILNKNFTP